MEFVDGACGVDESDASIATFYSSTSRTPTPVPLHWDPIDPFLSDTHGHVAFVDSCIPHLQHSSLTGSTITLDKQRCIATHLNSATTVLSSSSMARPVTQAPPATLQRFYLWFKGRCHCID
ncbi:hypothetical protein CPC08DRAFT_434434 [Agrocybe pediades]|nr:hypothetical protein CPC08DRAFT_434434 [Agrocybe pediades]